MNRMKSILKCMLQQKNLKNFFLKIKGYHIYMYKGGRCAFDKKSQIIGSTYVHFNTPHYRNGFYKNGNLYLAENSSLILSGTGRVVFYPGCKIDIFQNAQLLLGGDIYINDSTRIGVKSRVEIGENTVIGDEVSIHDFDGHKINGTEGIEPIKIGRHVWVGEKVTILKGVHIGDNSIIGAGSIVTKNIPSNVIAVGNPARVIKEIDNWS